MSVATTPTIARSAALPTGVTLQYVERGSPRGVPVVLLPGVTDSWGSFEGMLSLLPDSIHAFALSQRGHGDSSRPAGGYRMTDFAADVEAFLDSTGIASAIIVGHSMGSIVALQCAIDHPERVLGLALMGAAPGMCRNPAAWELWDSNVATLADPVDPAFVTAFQQGTLARPVPDGLLEAVVRESLKLPARVWRAAFAGILALDLAPDLSRIPAPTLVAWGDRDTIALRGDQQALIDGIPDSRLIVYPGGGHAFHWEEPAVFTADLIAFVESLSRRS
jgi:pimeloyl-ACP methyl ester carboxylesterase